MSWRMLTQPPFAPIISALPHLVPFTGPEAMERARGRPFKARLGANESSFGASPRAVSIMRQAAADNWMYSDPENFALRSAIAAFHRVAIENIMVGEGIDGLLGVTCMLFLAPGDSVVTTDGAYPTFNFHVLAHGGRLIALPMRDFHEDLMGLSDTAHRQRAKLIYVSNPNSPMGSWWPGSDLDAWIRDLPDRTMLVLDEAYCDTAPAGTTPPIDVSNIQVIRYRTFSKAYGLAGARIGYAIAHPTVIEAFDKVRNHYGINRVGQLGAAAALADQSFLADVVGRIARARDRISAIVSEHGLNARPSGASFVAVDCRRDGAFAKRVLDGLLARDVFVRKPVVPQLDRFIRVSCGRDDHLNIFAAALRGALDDAL